MLEEIRIAGLGVISEAVLEFGPALTVVTGETGAGKTMVVSGLALLFGGRADVSKLRPGVSAASVEGRLIVNPAGSAANLVLDAGGDLEYAEADRPGSASSADQTSSKNSANDSAELILRRVLSAGGRSRAVAGGASVPASVLAGIGAEVLVVHGQSDQLRLVQPAEQRAALDRFAGLDLDTCHDAFNAWQQAELQLAERRSGARELAREADLLRAGIAEIEAVAPQPDEDVELAALSARLEHSDALRIAARTAHDALAGDRDDPEAQPADVTSLLGQAQRALAQLAGTDPALDALTPRIAAVGVDVADIAAELSDYEARLDADPDRLTAVFSRRAVLTGLTRKYGTDINAVLGWADQARRRLAQTDTSEDALAELLQTAQRRRNEYAEAAAALSERRIAAATELSERITAELGGLGMPAARVRTTVSTRRAVTGMPTIEGPDGPIGAGPDGTDEVELALSSHPDAPWLPVQRGASGGELSRIMLAIEVVLAGTDPVPTMVFDEVDSGIGGRAAVEVGRRLARLAREHQVIVVTHLAQVAAFADRHLVVDKHIAGRDGAGADTGVTHSDIRIVTGAERVAELARMLAGDDTEAARLHAAELLENARQFAGRDAQPDPDRGTAPRRPGRRKPAGREPVEVAQIR